MFSCGQIPLHAYCTAAVCQENEFEVFLFKLLFAFFFLQNLLSGHTFLFLQSLLGYLFLLCNLLSWFRDNLLFFSEDHLSVAGRAHAQVDRTMGSAKS